jgi:secondary thiamine-phosphate synthase enzyme
MVHTHTYNFDSAGSGTIVDLTDQMKLAVDQSGIHSGTITAFIPGSTGGITTIEYEPGLLQDIPELLEKIVPSDRTYHHDETWQDGNGFSHLRAALIGPDVTVPFNASELMLGTWQQVVFLDFDNRPRQRQIIFQIVGDAE